MSEQKGLSLYSLTSAMIELLAADEISDDMLTAAFGDIQAKDNKICHFVRDIEASIKAHKEEEQRIATKRRAMENKVEQLKRIVKESMNRLGVKKIHTGTFDLCVEKSPAALEIDADAKPKGKYCIVIPATREWDKSRLKEDLKNGAKLKYARLTQGEHLRIR